MLRLASAALREVRVADCVAAWCDYPLRLACAACCGLHVAHCVLPFAASVCCVLGVLRVADCMWRIAWLRGMCCPWRLACAACCGLRIAPCVLRIAVAVSVRCVVRVCECVR